MEMMRNKPKWKTTGSIKAAEANNKTVKVLGGGGGGA